MNSRSPIEWGKMMIVRLPEKLSIGAVERELDAERSRLVYFKSLVHVECAYRDTVNTGRTCEDDLWTVGEDC